MWLVCSERCGGKLFRALFAEVEIDAGGEYQAHRVVQEGYLCLNCGAPAVDLGRVPELMDQDAEEDVVETSLDLLCPVCETMVAVTPGEGCPNCGAALEVV
jgi:rubrerythrin